MAAVLEKSPFLVLTDVPWDYYWRTREEFDESIHITYDHGRMEIMTPTSAGHDGNKKLIARLLETWALLRDVPLTGMGAVTLAREDFQRGVEPDECYYLHTTPPPLTPHEIDLTLHDPPDLVLEVDLSSLSIDKEPIYAELGVVEVWRWESDTLTIRRLRDDRTGYDTLDRSVLLPKLPIDALAEHIRLGREIGQPEALKRWRDRIAP